MLQKLAICIFKQADCYDHIKANAVTFNDLVYYKMMQIMYTVKLNHSPKGHKGFFKHRSPHIIWEMSVSSRYKQFEEIKSQCVSIVGGKLWN